MASIKNLKKDLNTVTVGIIEAAYIHQMSHPEEDSKNTESIVDEAVGAYDNFIVRINDRKVADRRKHLRQVHKDIEEKAQDLVNKLNEL